MNFLHIVREMILHQLAFSLLSTCCAKHCSIIFSPSNNAGELPVISLRREKKCTKERPLPNTPERKRKLHLRHTLGLKRPWPAHLPNGLSPGRVTEGGAHGVQRLQPCTISYSHWPPFAKPPEHLGLPLRTCMHSDASKVPRLLNNQRVEAFLQLLRNISDITTTSLKSQLQWAEVQLQSGSTFGESLSRPAEQTHTK